MVTKLLNQLNERLKESYYSFEFTDNVKHYILDSAFDERFGARPLKRFIQNNIETPLAIKILKGEIDTNTKFIVDYQNNELSVKRL